ncbi:MAG: alpha/beta fold hydrolase [Pseudobdellovibrionaceae bacterium]
MIAIKDSITAEDLMFPKSKPYDSGHLDVGDGHALYYQQMGNPNGPAVLLVHGGPGGGIEAGSRYTRLHDPSFFRIIAVDQRGCGLSTPHFADDPKKALRHNTPDKLADDFEKIREYLGIPAWHVFGYSWGSCLGAYYAAHYPKAALSLTIGGIWMHTPDEIDWYINRMGLFFPEAEAELLKQLPSSVKRFDRLGYLYKAITNKDKRFALKIAEAQGRFEDVAVHFESPDKQKETKPKQSAAEKKREQRDMIALGALEIFFMKEHPLPAKWYASNATKKALGSIKDFHLIQGRFDVVCPPTTAYDVAQAHPHAQLTMVHYAGHRTTELQMLQALLKAASRHKY